MTPLLQASGLDATLGGRRVLHGVDLAVAPGELVGLVGPNGAGKTTLLRALAGLQPPSAGEIRILGRPARAVGRAALARTVAYLPQDGAAHWDLAVADVVMLGRLPHMDAWRNPDDDDVAAAIRAMAATDVTDLAGRKVGRLSGGERARVLLARTLAVESQIVLADEPVTGLDPAHGLDVLDVLAQRARDGTAVVIVLHDLTLAMRCCSRLVLLDAGQIVADGPPGDVLSDANLASAYGVRAVRGEEGGRPYLVPLERTAREPRP